MKLLIIFSMIFTASFVHAQDVLLTCTKTSFTDLESIVVTSSDVSANEIIVTETSADGSETVYSRLMGEKETSEIELSDWSGYSRTLYNDGLGWNIEFHDECGGGVSPVTCF